MATHFGLYVGLIVYTAIGAKVGGIFSTITISLRNVNSESFCYPSFLTDSGIDISCDWRPHTIVKRNPRVPQIPKQKVGHVDISFFISKGSVWLGRVAPLQNGVWIISFLWSIQTKSHHPVSKSFDGLANSFSGPVNYWVWISPAPTYYQLIK